MAYDETLAERVRDILRADPGFTERRMFGGICFMLDGHMCCGIIGSDLMGRLGHEGAKAALARPHVRPMDFTGRPMGTAVYVGPEGLRGRALRGWVEKGAAHARSLPPKSGR